MPSQKVLEQKKQFVAELSEQLKGAKAGVVVDYQGINVADDTTLRKNLRESGVNYSVVKNTLLGRAADDAGLGELKSVLEGTTALATCDNDEIIAAKLLCEFAEKNDKIKIKAGFYDGKVVDAATVQSLAKVPPKDVLLAMLAGGLNGMIAGLARAVNAVAEQKGEAAPEA